MKTGTITHDILWSDVALVYRWNVTPEGKGALLYLRDDGRWEDADSGTIHDTIEDAEQIYNGP